MNIKILTILIIQCYDNLLYNFKNIYPENCFNIVLANLTLEISKLPHSVDTYMKKMLAIKQQVTFITHCLLLTPCWQRSNDNSLIKVVFPLPVGPVKIVNSPCLKPLRYFVKSGNRSHYNDCKRQVTLFDMCSYLYTSYFLSIKKLWINMTFKL